MEELERELENLILKLAQGCPAEASCEGQTLIHLRHIRSLVEDDGRPAELAEAFASLKQFWQASIAWCSELSRDVERLIIVYTDLAESANPSHQAGG